MLVAVLIPSYNRSAYIMETIQCMLNQTYSNIVVIVYDDGSNDGTWELLEKIKDPRLAVYGSRTNRGIPYARNRLMELAIEHGAGLAVWQDSDDLCAPNRIQRQLESHVQGGWTRTYYKKFTRAALIDRERRHGGTLFPTIMFDPRIVPKFREDYQLCGEDSMWMRELRASGVPQTVVPEPLYYYRTHAEQITATCRRMGIQAKVGTKRYAEYLEESVWNGTNHYLLGKTPVYQNFASRREWWNVLDRQGVVFEIGTKQGGWTMEVSKICPVYTYDIVDQITDEAVEALQATCGLFVNESYVEGLHLVREFDNLTIMCDGGNKIREFNTVAPLMRSGQIIGVHDYCESKALFKAEVQGKKWNWCECTYADIEKAVKDNGLVRVPGFDNSCWGVWRKS